METLSIVLVTIAFIILIEGFYILIFEKQIKNLFKELSKKSTKLRKIGVIELTIGFLLLMLVIFLK